jgi:hypothetical protein
MMNFQVYFIIDFVRFLIHFKINIGPIRKLTNKKRFCTSCKYLYYNKMWDHKREKVLKQASKLQNKVLIPIEVDATPHIYLVYIFKKNLRLKNGLDLMGTHEIHMR